MALGIYCSVKKKKKVQDGHNPTTGVNATCIRI